jgi:hypothetical protein
MTKARRAMVLALAAVAALCLSPSAVGWSSASAGRSLSAVRSMPERDEPILQARKTRSNSIVLQEGIFRNRHWQAVAFRPKPVKHGPVVCLELIVRHQLPGRVESLQSGGSECGRIDEESPRPVLTQFNIAGASLLAVAAPRIVQSVEFSVSPGPSFAKKFHGLNTRQREKIHLVALGYAAFRVQPAVCVKQLIGLAEDGTHLFETPARGC